MRLTQSNRRGILAPFAAIIIVFLLGMVAFAVDIGHLTVIRTALQASADAAALASVREVPNAVNLTSVARSIATQNHSQSVVQNSDVEMGYWNSANRTFTVLGMPLNSVRVTVRRTQATNNPVRHFFAPAIGINQSDVIASAIAVKGGGGGGRFILDDEVIDTDEPWIELLKSRFPSTPVEDFITDRNADFFIDLYDYLPATNKRVLMRTGQIGDEGLFDITANEGTNLPQFPFTSTSVPSFIDFLKYNKQGSPAPWVWSSAVENKLSPQLKGVGRFNSPGKYPPLVDPNALYISPVYKSDVNSGDSVGSPAVNGVSGAKDERRGLLAFKIVGCQNDPRGGSYLPNLIFEIVDPRTVTLSVTQLTGGSGKTQLVK